MNKEQLLKYEIDMDGELRGGSRQGFMPNDVGYLDLVEILGEPWVYKNGYKTDFEWQGTFKGEGFTIYNYKSGANYCGEEGLPIESHFGDDLHIGGKDTLRTKEFKAIILKLVEEKKIEILELIKKGKRKGCSNCGHTRFTANQIQRYNVVVDVDGNWQENCECYDSENPYSPFVCIKCGTAFEEL